MKFKVAIVQAQAIERNIDTNVELICGYMKEAAQHNADMVLLPECFITSYHLPIQNKEALSEESTYLKQLCDKAKSLQVGLVATAFTKGKNKPKNSAFVIDKQGTVLMKYDKVHTCDFADESCLESGNEFKVCDFDGLKLGIMICYDREYPESARILMLQGAEIILVPNDCGTMKPRIQALSTRAYENMVGIAMANPNGKNAGCSCAFSPICWNEKEECVDNTLLLADDVTANIFYAEFDMDEIRKYREKEMMGNTFRKVKTYGELLNEEVKPPFIRD